MLEIFFDDLSVISAEAKYLDGMGAQYDSEVIYHNMNEELKKRMLSLWILIVL